MLNRGANQLATGLVVLFLGLGLTSLFGAAYVQARRRRVRADRDVPVLSTSRASAPIFFDQDPLTYLSYVAGARRVVGAVPQPLGRAAAGRRRAHARCSPPTATRSLPIQYVAVDRRRHARRRRRRPAVDRLRQRLVREHDQGRGFIAVAVVIFAARQPFKVAAGAYLFGAALALSPALQARGYGINQFALDAVPYVVTLLVLVVLGRRSASRDPRGPVEGLRDRPGDLTGGTRTSAPTPTHHTATHREPRHPTRRDHHEHADDSHQPLAAVGCSPTAASLAACASNDSTAAASATVGDAPGQGLGRRSASSSSARRTTSATTRPPTRAARRSPRRFPDLEVLTAENVPEDDNATRVMETMIDKGAKIIFATSYGHLDPAHEGRRRPPRRRRRAAGQRHQRRRRRPTSGTYFGTVYEPVYLAGIAAGKATEVEQARLRLRLPDPPDDRQHQRLRARAPSR